MPANGQVINLSLNMTANTAQARQELQNLQTVLNNLTQNAVTKNSIGGTLTKDISQATTAAIQLKTQLQNATNIKTGQLDLGMLSTSLKQSGMTLEQYRTQFNKLGPEGTAAFNQVATSITQAAAPMKQSNALIEGMWTNLKKVASWQISSSILHGFMSSIKGAYNYAQDLNKSLNNIQIVTGQNTAEMAKFAEQANKSAKALSSTTTEYTDAALIFYQQGLTGKDVTDRTNVAIKMANVTGQSAQDISNQMTAIWNNFDDGSESLEHYADVITNLGAHTASSSKEIAEGLEKFAAIGDTVGLSYEYATTALATVVAQTRQSADTVGTAFKTIFSRLQGLSLGETLEDGTDLNKYSEGLQKVGVNIKEADGSLREMDEILNDLGGKWQTLEQDQKMALAQTVAGTRQYTQLVALMDNWGTFQENLNYADNAEGTLQKQQDTYAESWEGASKRVKAAAEEMYSALLNDKFFIGITNFTGGLIEGFTKVIKAAGGLPTLLMAIIPLINRLFGPQISAQIDNTVLSLRRYSKSYQEQAEAQRQQGFDVLKANINQQYGEDSIGGQAINTSLMQRLKLQQQFVELNDQLSENQKIQLQTMLDLQNEQIEELKNKEKAVKLTQQQLELEEKRLKSDSIFKSQEAGLDAQRVSDKMSNQAKVVSQKTATATVMAGLDDSINKFDMNNAEKIKLVKEEIKKLKQSVGETGQVFEETFGQENNIDKLNNRIEQTEEQIKQLNNLKNQVTNGEISAEEVQNQIGNMQFNFKDTQDLQGNISGDIESINQLIDNLEAHVVDSVHRMASGASAQADNAKIKLEEYAQDIASEFDQATKQATSSVEKLLNQVKEANKEDKKNIAIQGLKNIQQNLGSKAPKEFRQAVQIALDDLTIGSKNADNVLAQLMSKLQAAGIEIKNKFLEDSEAIKKLAESTGLAEGEITNILRSILGIGKAAKDSFNSNAPITFGQKFTTLASTISSVGMALSSLNGLINTWNNQDLSFGEKFITTLTTLGMVVSSLTMVFNENNAQILTSIGLKIKSALAQDADTKAKYAAAAANKTLTATEEGAAVAAEGLNVALGVVGIAIAAIGALLWVFTAISDAIKNSKTESEKAATAASGLGTALSNAKQAAENLKSTFDKYDTALDKLNNCVKYTKEWYKALNDVNNQTTELINKYPELLERDEKGNYKYLDVDKDTGTVTINEAGQTLVNNKATSATATLTAAQTMATKDANQKKISEKEAAFDYDIGFSQIDNDQAKQLIQKNIEDLSQYKTTDELANAIKKIWSENAIVPKGANMDTLNKEFETNSQLIAKDLLKDNSVLLNSMATKIEDTTQRDNSLTALLSSNSQNIKGEELSNVVTAMGNYYEQIVQENKNNFDQKTSDEQVEAIKKYLDSQSIDYAKVTVDGDKFSYTTKDGNEVKDQDINETKYFTAVNESIDKVVNSGEKLANFFNKLDSDKNNSTSKALKTFSKNKNFEELSKGDFDQFSSDFSKMDEKTFKAKYGISDEDLQAMGYKDWAEYSKAINDAQQQYTKSENAINVEQFGINPEATKELGLQTAKELQNTFNKVLTDEGKNDLSGTYNYIFEDLQKQGKLTQENIEKVFSAFNSVDFSSWDAGDKLKQALDGLDLSINTAGIDWDGLSNRFRKSSGAIPITEYKNLKNTLEQISTITSDLKLGDEISKKDYDSLIAANPEFANNFSQQSNGKYKVTNADFNLDTITQMSSIISQMDDLSAGYEALTNAEAEWASSDNISKYATKTKDNLNDAKNNLQNYIDQINAEADKSEEEQTYTNMFKAMGYSVDEIKSIMQSGDLEDIQAFYTALNNINTEGAAGNLTVDDATLEQLKSRVKTMEELSTIEEQLSDDQTSEVLNSMMVNTAEEFGLASDAISNYATNLQNTATSSDKISDSLATNSEAAKKVALANTRMNQGLTDLRSNLDSYKNILKSGKTNTVEFSTALQKAQKDVGNLLNIDGKALSDSFYTSTENLKLMEKASKGNVKAIEKLRDLAAEDIITTVTAQLSDEDAKTQVQQLHTWMQNYLDKQDLTIGADIDNSKFIAKCNEMLETAQMSTEQAASYFQSLGYDADLETKTIEVPSETTETRYDEKGKKLGTTKIERKDKITVAAVKSLTYNGSAGGTINYSNTKQGIADSDTNKGSGSSSSKSTEDTKKMIDEEDRYHTITKQIEATTTQLTLLDKAKSRAYGKDKLKAMNDEIKAQKTLLKQEKEKARQAQKNVKLDASYMKGYGAQIGKDGSIKNYKQMLQQQVNMYNQAVKKYNASEQTDADKTALDNAKTNYETFKKHLEKYEDSIKTAQDQATKIAEAKAKILQLKLEKIDYKLQIKVDIDERKLAKLEKRMSRLQNANFTQAKQISNIAKQANSLIDQSNNTRKAMRETIQAGTDKNLTKKQIDAIMSGKMSKKQMLKLGFTSETIDQLTTYRDKLEDINDKLIALQDQIPDTINTFMDQYLDKMKTYTAEIEYQQKLMKNMQTIADLLGPQAGLSKENKLLGQQAIVENAQTNIRANKAIRDTAQQEYEQFKAEYDRAAKKGFQDEATKQKWEDDLKARLEAWQNAELEMQNATIAGLQAIQEAWKAEAKLIIEEAKKAADEAVKTFNETKEVRDRYYAEYKRMYETSKLVRQINQSMEKTDNLKSQKLYNGLLKEVAQYQKTGAEMSKYDIEYLQKKYALTEAQIALEESRNAKSQVRLSRDSEGNYGYVYTADDSNVDKAQQNYEDKLYELQNFMATSIDELANQYVQSMQKMYQEIESINNDMTLSDTERKDKLDAIYAHYSEMQQFYLAETQDLTNRGKDINREFVDYNGELSNLMAEDIHGTIFDKIYPDVGDFQTLLDSHRDQTKENIRQLNTAFGTYESRIDTACKNAGIDVKDFNTTYSNMAKNVIKKSGDAADSTEDMREKQATEYGKIKTQLDNWYKNVESNVKKVINKNKEAANSVDKIKTAYVNATSKAKNAATAFDKTAEAARKAKAAIDAMNASAGKSGSGSGGGGGSNNNNNGNGTIPTNSNNNQVRYRIASNTPNTRIVLPLGGGKYATFKNQGQSASSATLLSVDSRNVILDSSSIKGGTGGNFAKIKIRLNGYEKTAYLDEHYLETYDTGGYTGDWGADGKLAMLHEKELVLNKSDTENVLTIVDIVRNLIKDLGKLTIFGGTLRSVGTQGLEQQTLEQKVEIKAEFPNVQDHNEIEQAFENLVNQAAQFANLK